MKQTLLAVLVVLASGCVASPEGPERRPRNVILFIGDGMGFSQVTLGRLAKGGPDAVLALDGLPVTGFVRTHSADGWVTDSAASATTLASGQKTKNFVVGMDPGLKPLKSLTEMARDKGYATGLVTTARITHATPAPFAAHVSSRYEEKEIAAQLAESGVDVLLGGGEMHFPAELVAKFTTKGYQVVRTKDEMWNCAATRILGLFAEEHLPYVSDRPAGCPTLAEMTRKAIGAMGGRPYFLMIEGARIDMACHANDAVGSARETIDFDDAVKAALEAAGPETLVIVTADHATGGLAVTEKAQSLWANAAKVKASAEKIDRIVRPDFTLQGAIEPLKAALKEWAAIEDVTDDEAKAYALQAGKYDPAARIGEILSRRVGCTFIPMDYRLVAPNTLHGHDGAMVPVYATGPGSKRFAGTLDNTEIPRRVREVSGF
jgi:alkaline phosphatase